MDATYSDLRLAKIVSQYLSPFHTLYQTDFTANIVPCIKPYAKPNCVSMKHVHENVSPSYKTNAKEIPYLEEATDSEE